MGNKLCQFVWTWLVSDGAGSLLHKDSFSIYFIFFLQAECTTTGAEDSALTKTIMGKFHTVKANKAEEARWQDTVFSSFLYLSRLFCYLK